MNAEHLYVGWQLDPVLIGGLIAVATAYAMVVGPLRSRLAPGEPFPKTAAIWFYAALALFYLVEGSPLHDLAERYLLSAHMVQHLLLSYVIARMIMVGLPAWLWRRILLHPRVAPLSRAVLRPAVTFIAFGLFFSVWHIPAVYQLQLINSTMHHVTHLLYLLVAMMLWWPILSPLSELPKPNHLVRLAYLFTVPVAQMLVFAIITFSPDPVYPMYAMAPRAFGLDPIADQVLAGAIMKVFGFGFFAVPFSRIFIDWYQRENGRNVTQSDMRREGEVTA